MHDDGDTQWEMWGKVLTNASLNCQNVGLVKSRTEDGRTARRVQAKLWNNNRKKSNYYLRQHCHKLEFKKSPVGN